MLNIKAKEAPPIVEQPADYPTPSGGAEPCLSGHELFLLRFSTADLMAYTSTTRLLPDQVHRGGVVYGRRRGRTGFYGVVCSHVRL